MWVDCHGGQTYAVELKIRRQDCLNYGMDDVVLEIISNAQSGTPGWAVQPKPKTAFLVVVWADTQRALKMPAEGLQRAVNANLSRWWEQYPTRTNPTAAPWAQNGRYSSTTITVPRAEILRAIAASSNEKTGGAA